MLIGKCLVELCPNPCAPALKRGLCLKCYSKAKKMVDAGTTTWEQLVEMGLAITDSSFGDAYADPFTKEFNRRKNASDK